MKSLSDYEHYGQQSVPETILPFPGLDAIPPALPDIIPFDADGEFTGEFDDYRPDDPAPSIPVALTIRASRGPQPVVPGLRVSAVVLGVDEDGEDDILQGQFLSGKMSSESLAELVANMNNWDRSQLAIPATHILINDHTGREVHRIPLMEVA